MSRKVLVLGHKGMLGNAVSSYLKSLPGYDVVTLSARWGEESFASEIQNVQADYIVNCIGAIPQRKRGEAEYLNLNYHLPVFLDSLGVKIVHPTTDCEFSGNLPPDKKYTKDDKRDATDLYGVSKIKASLFIESEGKNTKIIRTSIIGHELSSNVSLLDWFLSSEGEVSGYTDHYWNGVTTLFWAQSCQKIIECWDEAPVITQLGLDTSVTKYELLELIKKVYNKDIVVTKKSTGLLANKALLSDDPVLDIESQLRELKSFYKK